MVQHSHPESEKDTTKPINTGTDTSTNGSSATAATAPTYQSATAQPQPPSYHEAQAAISSLTQGDPNETISVPMITRHLTPSIHNYNPFSRKSGEIKQSVIVREMKRSHYTAHYAKDAQGNFVGTGTPARDVGLVFVPSKGSGEDMLKQAQEVALRVQRQRGKGIGKFGMPLPDPEGLAEGR